jgi:hypothetical protein
MKYKKKPVIIEAIQLLNNNSSIEECLKFIYNVFITDDDIETVKNDKHIRIQTLEGNMKASFGDYIIKGVNGEFYPCKPDIFEKTYESIK